MKLLVALVGLLAASAAIPLDLARRQTTATETPSYNYINYTQYNSTSTAVEIDVYLSKPGRNLSAPLLYGWMHEDISHSGDGGIYAEMLSNRAFQGSDVELGSVPGIPGASIVGAENPLVPWGPVLSGWHAIGDVKLSLTALHPLSDALPIVMQVDIPWNATGEVGILNQGWWGFDVRPQTYNASFYVKADSNKNNGTLSGINVSLRSNLTSEVWAQSTIGIHNMSTFRYQHLATPIVNEALAPNSNNSFLITFDASEVAGNTFYFGLFSLFPETYKNRPNGIRKDLGQAVEDLGSKSLRFPGGNNIEGYSLEQRWKWNETIGPLINRKGRPGVWEYYNTNGLGLVEYFEFCEDAGMEPILGVFAGLSLDLTILETSSWPEDSMDLVLEDILNELEFITGDVSTKWGALRAEYGHPEPFKLNYVEIGNEDWLSETYPYRFPYLYQGIKQAYPHLTLISTAYNENEHYNISIPAGGMWDTHHYQPPSYFLENFDFYDNWQEDTGNQNVTIFLGEYSVYQYDTFSGLVNFSAPLDPHVHIYYPTLMAAIGEGVYLLGMERNPDVVKLSAYAPSFANLNALTGTPNLVSFTANYDETVLSVSYYMERLFSIHHGHETLPSDIVTGDYNPLWWAASVNEMESEVYVKVINSGNSSIPLTINLDKSYKTLNGSIITNPSLDAYNFLSNQTGVVDVPIEGLPEGPGDRLTWSVPAYSINVLQFDLT